ncbi:RNA-directed DNA polymerase, eukaryota, reverse transcriptase zinc-binding domain protein [Tanacetum coccineum]|uniref:RNA-directed DNA polymerase, eukaryota, reverse transcriptase zinc-binding domain protein n=1 Tax=Tanacetum coccineum TaxID=301880 RepID=A0ABQ4XAG8_9ASTR
MMERMTSKGKGVVIEEIMDHDVNDVVGKEFDSESGNSGKLPLLEWHQSSQAGKDETVVNNDFCVFNSDNEFPPPWSAERMNANRAQRMSDEFEFKKLLAEIDHEFGLETLTPMKVINVLESIRSRLFWGFKDKHRVDALWRKVVKSFYGSDGGSGSSSVINTRHGTWCDIINTVSNTNDIDPTLKNSFTLKISNGRNTFFWKDVWCCDGFRLMDRFPRLFSLESDQDCKVSDHWRLTNGVWGGTWSWIFPPRGRALDDLSSLISSIGNVSLSLDGVTNGLGVVMVQWNSWIPHKVNICVWRASINRLATWANLVTRGINMPSTFCLFCELEVEMIDHCPLVLLGWRKI